MGLLDRFKKKTPPESEPSNPIRYMLLADNKEAWSEADDNELMQAIVFKCLEYGGSEDMTLIMPLFEFYRYGIERFDPKTRLEMLLNFTKSIEQNQGAGVMCLMMFLAADNDYGVISTAAMNMAVLKAPENDDPLDSVRFVVRSASRDPSAENIGSALAGILLLGDKRVLPILEEAWDGLADEGRLRLTRAKSGLVTEALVEFWISCLEKECSEEVTGSLIAAVAKLPFIANYPYVFNMERVLPAYKDPENPVHPLRRTSFTDYLEEIRPRLEALEEEESEPKLIPSVYAVWEDPDQFPALFSLADV